MKSYFSLITKVLTLSVVLGATCLSQTAEQPSPGQGEGAVALFRKILKPTLSPSDVHQLRQVSIDREDLHISFSDGQIALIQTIDGHTTGAIFQGEGDILLLPPNRAERTSLALFTKAAVLNQKFKTAYLRFLDDRLAEELQRGFRPPTNPQEFIDKWQTTMESLARADSLSLLQAMTNSGDSASGFIHLRVAETELGIFDVFFDTSSAEQIAVAQTAENQNGHYYDTWTSFPMRSRRESGKTNPFGSPIHVSDFRVFTKVIPPTDLAGEAELTVVARKSGRRTFLMELSRYLKVTEVKLNGQPVEFIQNEAIEGSELARRGNDFIAVVLPAPLEKDRPAKLTFRYSGSVMFDTGEEVIYVGNRGTWYPNSGPGFANFDLTFEYPPGWTLVATGKPVSSSNQNGMQTARFVSDKPISHAGFNLGKFETARGSAGDVVIDAYAAKNVERSISRPEAKAGLHPEPAKQVQRITGEAAATVTFLANELDPFPYSHLEITQLPALLSQSWPGLIYLSSMAFLTPDERHALGVKDPYTELLLSDLMLAHETAHQWWGDAVDWESYRDQWIIEALANYSALVMLERANPERLKLVLNRYRDDLLRSTPNGILAEAGPVTLGQRLTSSKFPQAFEPVLYGRGTWLIHMLRSMMREAGGGKSDALFFGALKGLLAKSPNGKISTRDLQHAFEEALPPALAYEGQKSLDWFFDSWINGASIPQFTLADVHLAPSGSQVKVRGIVRQAYADKNMVTAMPIYAVDKGGQASFISFIFVDEPDQEFQISAPVGTTSIVLDPQGSVLRRGN
ncbi:MAG TPA: M1 family aminopeptidase [Candidatus Angelobacter sp.]|jgi:hypothetical protein|nr:M1 family aminopeptidase [Candidatus Angelobacter sp.]